MGFSPRTASNPRPTRIQPEGRKKPAHGASRWDRRESSIQPRQGRKKTCAADLQEQTGRQRYPSKLARLALLHLCIAAALLAQTPAAAPAPDAASAPRSTYVLGPDDQIIIQAIEADEISGKSFRIGPDGYLHLPTAGRILAAGLTAEQLGAAIADQLKRYIKDPDVAVSITEYRSQPVSILGSVKSPGVHQLQGRKSLIEVLSLAGGTTDDAGHSVKIVRRREWGPIPLPGAHDDETAQFSVAEVDLKEIVEARNPSANIVICPEDVITVPRAEMIYVVGQVTRPGGYVLNGRQTLSVLQAYTLAGGADKTASPKNARILRAAPSGSARVEVAINISKILSGDSQDIPLQAEDILFVPSSNLKKALSVASQATSAVAVAAIYRLP